MRIGMVMDTAFPPDARVENEAITLMEKGHDVFLFYIDYRQPHKRSAAGPEDSDTAGPVDMNEFKGIKLTGMAGNSLLYKLSALVCTLPFFRWMVLPRIRQFIRETQVDILHIHDMVIAEAVMNANRSFMLPVVLDLHENRPEIMKLYKHVNRWPGRWLINLKRWRIRQRELMEKADHVVLVTEEARQWASQSDRIPEEKITAVPNVIRLGSFDTEAADDSITRRTRGRFTLLYIGDTSLRRGTGTLLEAVKLLEKQIPELQMLFVGAGSQDSELYKFVHEHNLSHLVEFEGWQDPARLPAYIHASDLCLSPLLRNPHHDTTYANKLFQYMAVGKPVVVSDCPAQAAVVREEECGLIHRAGDAEDLAKSVLRLYRDPDTGIAMGERGANAVRERWNWELTGENLLQVYRLVFRMVPESQC